MARSTRKIETIKYKLVKRYECEDCGSSTDTEPCPVCVARRARDAMGRGRAAHRKAVDISPYVCEKCSIIAGYEVMTTTSPCRACASRHYGIRRQHPCGKVPVTAVEWIEIPGAVADWLNERLGHMIGAAGQHSDVSEAIEYCTAQVRGCISSIAIAIGAKRRQKKRRTSIAPQIFFKK